MNANVKVDYRRMTQGKEAAILDVFPSDWLDPLLTGPNKVIGNPPFSCQDIERLIEALKGRVARAL